MPNNPFESFHDLVAEAKAEREQLDRLLTVSTSRERLLVAAIGLVLAILMGWLFFGSIPREVALQGALVEPSVFQADGGRSVRAVVWAGPGAAADLKIGLPVKVVVNVPGGGREALDGTLAGVAAARVSGAGAESAQQLPLPALAVDISLSRSLDLGSLAGPECRIVVELGRQPPVAPFGLGRS